MSEWVNSCIALCCVVCVNQSPIQLLSIDSISVLALPFILIKKFYCAYFFYLIGITSYRLISYPIVSNWIGSDRIGSYESVALFHTHGMSLSLSPPLSLCVCVGHEGLLWFFYACIKIMPTNKRRVPRFRMNFILACLEKRQIAIENE